VIEAKKLKSTITTVTSSDSSSVTSDEEEQSLRNEERELGRELAMFRGIAKLKNGGTLPDFDEEMKRNPDLADYKKRRDDFEKRKEAFYAAHPEKKK
jgi:hypothetical protein